jgi:hypothetical protein
MPKIRDLGISVIPATMRPPEIGGGAASAPCNPTGDQDCLPTDPQRNPAPPQSNPQQCNATPDDQCCPTDHDSNVEKDHEGGEGITPDSRKELQQQLRDRIGLQL